MKKHKKIIILSSMIIGFFLLGFMVRGSSEGVLFDLWVMNRISRNSTSPIFKLMKLISFIGSSSFIIPGTAMILAYSLVKKRYRSTKLIILSTGGTWILNFLLKQVFYRTRPLEYFLVDQGGYSFPSGHSMVTMTLFLTLAHLISRGIKEEGKKNLVKGLALTFIILMGISRIYLGVHWPTDVIGGYLIGYIFYYLSLVLVKD